MLVGELIVTGRNEIEIELDHRRPERITVVFEDKICTPCDNDHHSNNHDQVWFQLENPHHARHTHHTNSYHLVIYWHVADFRIIKWKVHY